MVIRYGSEVFNEILGLLPPGKQNQLASALRWGALPEGFDPNFDPLTMPNGRVYLPAAEDAQIRERDVDFSGESPVKRPDQMIFDPPQVVPAMVVGGINAGAQLIPAYLLPEAKWKFGKKSQAELKGVLPKLVEFATLALRYSRQDFMVYDGLRTEAEQREYVRRGVSKTMNSKHRKQADGFSHAVDLVPVVDVRPVWDWKLIFPIVAAADFAATELGIADNIRWGGAWDRTLADFGGDPSAYEREIRDYAARHPGKDFLDGPHFEWRE